jgi:hypothetical protein
MKFTNDRPFADPDKAARRQKQHAHAFEPVQDGRIYIEKLNGPFLFGDKGTPAEYAAGLIVPLAWAGWKFTSRPCASSWLGRLFSRRLWSISSSLLSWPSQLVLRRFWSIRIGTQRSVKGSFSLVKCRKTRGVGMTFENKVAFAVLRLM